jgi:hypothetical protein
MSCSTAAQSCSIKFESALWNTEGAVQYERRRKKALEREYLTPHQGFPSSLRDAQNIKYNSLLSFRAVGLGAVSECVIGISARSWDDDGTEDLAFPIRNLNAG